MTLPVRDLHTHSNCSDGLYEPGELVQEAARSGVQELSLTDHDTLAGLGEARATAEALGLRFLPGIEFTCRYEGRTAHLLGYGFDPSTAHDDAPLTQYLDHVRASDLEWARAMCRQSCEDSLVVRTPGGVERHVCVQAGELNWVRGTMPSPFHFAVVLSQKLLALSDELDVPARHCMYLLTGRPEPERKRESYWPALQRRYASLFARYGIDARPHWWTPRPTEDLIEFKDALGAIGRIGGIPVLAHPQEQELRARHIAAMVDLGLQGVEVYTYKHSPEQIVALEILAAELGLLITAGTDFHDPYHRAQVELGQDRSGRHLTQGLSLDGFAQLGGYVSGPKV
jgi:predicted metal-dependent phosphoesterase TrpH